MGFIEEIDDGYIEVYSETYCVEEEKIYEAIRLLSKNENKLGLTLIPIDGHKISLFEYVWCYKINFELYKVYFM